MSIYDYSVPKADGGELSLRDYEGKVILIVNTATGCGFTPQYKELEQMYEAYHDKGFEIVDIPCNQFMNQAPGSDNEIKDFCTSKYNTQFEQMKKSDVNGENALPIYAYLKEQKGFAGLGEGKMAKMLEGVISKFDKDFKTNPDIKWNFTKFVVDRSGNVVARFEPTVKMEDVDACVASLV